MKRALLNSLEPGRVCDVVDSAGAQFPVAHTFTWIDCPDHITTQDTYNQEADSWEIFDILNQEGFINEGWRIARSIEYGNIGDQLDMIYKEIRDNGTISQSGPWATHIQYVKDNIPKDNPAAVLAWIREHQAPQVDSA